jgi:hypothetical protein
MNQPPFRQIFRPEFKLSSSTLADWMGLGDESRQAVSRPEHGCEQKIAAHLVKDLKRAMQPK